MQYKEQNSGSKMLGLPFVPTFLLLIGVGLLSPSNGVDAQRFITPIHIFNYAVGALAIGIIVYAIMLVVEHIENQ